MTKTTLKIATALAATGMILATAIPAFGSALGGNVNLGLNVNVKASTTVDAKVTSKMKERADKEIARRIARLNQVLAKIQGMARVSDTVKANLKTSIDLQVAALTNLKVKIAADTDIEMLKADVKSITGSYRIFALVIPQGEIIAAADRVNTVAQMTSDLGVKLQARITLASTAGKDVAALNAALVDLNAKVADARTQSTAAVNAIANLTPDNGDKAKMAANEASLKDARGKIKIAQEDLVKARQDAKVIVKGLKELKIEVKGNFNYSSLI
jgi:hypothetical protein